MLRRSRSVRALALIVLLTLTACQPWQIRASDTCVHYGYRIGTEPYAGCMERFAAQEQAQHQAALAALAGSMLMQDMARQPPLAPLRPALDCTTTRMGSTSFMQCY